MARKPRVNFAGGLYHVMSRGNQGQSIFRDDQDRERYLGDDACSGGNALQRFAEGAAAKKIDFESNARAHFLNRGTNATE